MRAAPVKSSLLMRTSNSSGAPGKSHLCMGVGFMANYKQGIVKLRQLNASNDNKKTVVPFTSLAISKLDYP